MFENYNKELLLVSETATISILFRNRMIQLFCSREYHLRIHSRTTDAASQAQTIALLNAPQR